MILNKKIPSNFLTLIEKVQALTKSIKCHYFYDENVLIIIIITWNSFNGHTLTLWNQKYSVMFRCLGHSTRNLFDVRAFFLKRQHKTKIRNSTRFIIISTNDIFRWSYESSIWCFYDYVAAFYCSFFVIIVWPFVFVNLIFRKNWPVIHWDCGLCIVQPI